MRINFYNQLYVRTDGPFLVSSSYYSNNGSELSKYLLNSYFGIKSGILRILL